MHLDLTVSAEASGDAIEVAIVVAGMTDELEDTVVGQGGENLGEGGGVEVSCGRDAEGPAGGTDDPVAELRVAFEGRT
jgi:hypothetical protein